MDSKLIEYYEERFRMFGSQGWKDLIEDVSLMYKTTNNIKGITDEKTLHYRQGELNMMEWLLALEEISKKAYDELIEEENDTV